VPFAVPDDVTPTTLETDANCVESIAAGRPEFDLLITSGTVIDDAYDLDDGSLREARVIHSDVRGSVLATSTQGSVTLDQEIEYDAWGASVEGGAGLPVSRA